MCNDAIAQTIAHCKYRVPICRCRSLFAGTFSLTYKYCSQHVNKQFTVPFSLHRTFWCPIQLFQASPRLYQYSKTLLRTFSTHVYTQSAPRARDAVSNDEEWTLTERRDRHLERTVPGRYLLSYYTVTRCHYFFAVRRTAQITHGHKAARLVRWGSWRSTPASAIYHTIMCTEGH